MKNIRRPVRVKESNMMKDIETIVMSNNWIGKEAELADTFGIKYGEIKSSYNEETNNTVINYIRRAF